MERASIAAIGNLQEVYQTTAEPNYRVQRAHFTLQIELDWLAQFEQLDDQQQHELEQRLGPERS